MNIAIFPHLKKEKSLEIAKEISKFFQKNDIQIISEDFLAESLNAKKISSFDKNKIDIMISIGGDGSILYLNHQYFDIKAPILGVNLGQIGFMADIPITELYDCLQDVIDKKFSIEKRIMLETSYKGKKFISSNEIVLHRHINSNLIDIEVFVDKKYVSTFSADGLIIATPNGSTAYSLSAGGPIVTSDVDAFIITPICPHTISARPIIVSANSFISCRYLSDHKDPIELRIDGIESEKIKKEDVIEIKKSDGTFDLIKLNRHDYFKTLNSKLRWCGKIF